jgi:NADH-quinone oxidoreductase subunit J
MTLYALCFYILAGLILGATGLAVTRRHPVHAVVYLILSFLGSALLFTLLGAPFLAALEVIIYAGAVMVLFLFVIMTLKAEVLVEAGLKGRKWLPALSLGFLYLVLVGLIIFFNPRGRIPLQAAMATPRALGRFVFEKYWLAVELISLLLLIGLVAVIQLGRGVPENKNGEKT